MEEDNDSFFQNKENFDKFQRKFSNVHHQNQSTEVIPSEDIFINQKEEIRKIKKKRLELKDLRESYRKRKNLKCIHIKKEKIFAKYYTLNTITSSKSDIKENKENEFNILKEKRKKSYSKNNNRIKLKLINDFDVENEDNNENIKNKIINEDIEIDLDDDIIINNDSENITIKNNENELDFLSLSNIDYFEKCECEIKGSDNYYNDGNNLPIINENWMHLKYYLNNNDNHNSIANFDFSGIVLKTRNYVDYNTKGIEINIHLKLYSESSFYIFTRCYIDDNNDTNNNTINNTINNSEEIKKYKTENIFSARKNKINQMLSKYSTVIKIFKNKNSKKSFVSFGTFYKSRKSGNIHYKTFLQRQLVDYLHQDKNYYYLENDLCEFDIIIIDLGNEYLEAKIALNSKDRYNNIKSNFYLPTNKKAKLMFCGEGKSAIVNDLKVRSFIKLDEEKERTGLLLSSEKKSCDCCTIL